MLHTDNTDTRENQMCEKVLEKSKLNLRKGSIVMLYQIIVVMLYQTIVSTIKLSKVYAQFFKRIYNLDRQAFQWVAYLCI